MTNIIADGTAFSDDGSAANDMTGGGFRRNLLPMLGAVMRQTSRDMLATKDVAQEFGTVSEAIAAANDAKTKTQQIAVQFGDVAGAIAAAQDARDDAVVAKSQAGDHALAAGAAASDAADFASQAGSEKRQAEEAKNQAQTHQIGAQEAEANSSANALRAESARDAAIVGAELYPDEETGRAAVAVGEAFKVQGSGNSAVDLYRRISDSASVLIAQIPATAVVTALQRQQVIYATEAEGRAAVADGETFNVQGTGPVAAYQYRRISAAQSSLLATFPATAFVDATAVAARSVSDPTAEFYNGDAFATTFAAVPLADSSGAALIGVEEDGRTHLLNEAVFSEFHNDDSSLVAAALGSDGAILIGWEDSGAVSVPGLALPDPSVSDINLLPYVAAGQIHAVGANDRVAADLGGFSALAVHAVSPLHVAAVIDRPSISEKTAVAAAVGMLVPYPKNVLHVVIGLGQSLMVGAQSASTIISTEAEFPELVLMFDSGATSDVRMGLVTIDGGTAAPLDPASLTGFVPLVAKVGQGGGSRGQTAMESFANALTAAAADIGVDYRSLCFTAAMGGTAYSGLKKGSQTYTNMLLALNKAKELADANGWQIIVDGCLVKHGEADSGSTTYLANLLEWQADVDADVKAITGQKASVHFFLSQPSTFTTTTPRAVQAMLDAHNTSAVHHLVGADYPFGSEYASDLVHFKGAGYFYIGEQFYRAWTQVLWTAASESKITQITQATRVGQVVTLKYSVPVPPLVFDTTTISERDVKGFTFSDSSGPIAITSAAITNTGVGTGVGEIQLSLASTPNGSGESVSYAYSPKVGADMPRGNVRDSDSLVSKHDGRHLYNWAAHQKINL